MAGTTAEHRVSPDLIKIKGPNWTFIPSGMKYNREERNGFFTILKNKWRNANKHISYPQKRHKQAQLTMAEVIKSGWKPSPWIVDETN